MRTILAGLLALSLSSCASDPAVGGKPDDGPRKSVPKQLMIEYRGPKAEAELDGSQLIVNVEVPTGGYALSMGRSRRDGDLTKVELTLTSPGHDEGTTQAFETKTQRVALPDEKGDVHVFIQELQRGAHYVTDPPFKLAVICER